MNGYADGTPLGLQDQDGCIKRQFEERNDPPLPLFTPFCRKQCCLIDGLSLILLPLFSGALWASPLSDSTFFFIRSCSCLSLLSWLVLALMGERYRICLDFHLFHHFQFSLIFPLRRHNRSDSPSLREHPGSHAPPERTRSCFHVHTRCT